MGIPIILKTNQHLVDDVVNIIAAAFTLRDKIRSGKSMVCWYVLYTKFLLTRTFLATPSRHIICEILRCLLPGNGSCHSIVG